MRLPDMIIAGAPRCGTSWLYEVADRHPRIEMAKPRRPEPKFFLDDTIYARGLDYYSRTWFDAIAPDKIAGEKSTNYLESAAAARRIREHLPAVKLIFMLRNPVERAFSNYRWSKMNGLEAEDFDTALDLEASGVRETPAHLQFARPFDYLARGLYRKLLEPWFERFAREQILCLRYEDIAADAGSLAVRLHRFLGVESRAGDAAQIGVVNAAPFERKAATGMGPNAGHDADEGIGDRGDREDEPHAAMSAATRARLEQFYAAPNRALGELLGPEFAIW